MCYLWALRPPGPIILGGKSSWGIFFGKIGGKYEIERKRDKERDEENRGSIGSANVNIMPMYTGRSRAVLPKCFMI